MANKPTPADFSPTVPDFPSIGQYQPIYGKFDLTTYIQGASDYEIMAFLVQCYNATLKGYSDVTQLSKDTVTAYNQLQTWVNTWFDGLDIKQEIDTKLSQMNESGELDSIIASSEAMIPAINNYFASEDGNAALSNKTSEKINNMASNGTLTDIVKETAQVPPAVTQYLNTVEGSEKLSNATAEKINNMATNGTLTNIVKETAQIPPAVTQYLNTVEGYEKLSNATAEKINDMATTGELGTVISGATDLQKTATDWLHDNVTPVGSAVVVDKSLTIEGAAADSKATGNSIDSLKDGLGSVIYPYVNISEKDNLITKKLYIPIGAKFRAETLNGESFGKTVTLRLLDINKNEIDYYSLFANTSYRDMINNYSKDIYYVKLNNGQGINAFKTVSFIPSTLFGRVEKLESNVFNEMDSILLSKDYLRNGSISNAKNSEVVASKLLFTKAKSIKVVTDRPNKSGFKYVYSYASSSGICFDLNNTLPFRKNFIDYSEPLNYSDEYETWNDGDIYGVQIAIGEYNPTTKNFNPLRVSDFEGYKIYVYDTTGLKNSLRLDLMENEKGLPSFYDSYILDRIENIKSKDILIGNSGDSFTFITDLHNENNYYSPFLAKKIYDNTSVKKIVYGGDYINEPSSKEETLSLLSNRRNKCIVKDDVIFLRGNHDTNPYGTGQLTLAEFYSIFDKHIEKHINTNKNTYFYNDNESQKIRYIFVDSGVDGSISEAQKNWIRTNTENLNVEWTLVIFMHHGIYTDVKDDRTNIKVYASLTSVKEALANVTCKIACIICGHSHIDLSDTSGKYPIICTTCDAHGVQASSMSSDNRDVNTINEQAFDVFHIDTANKKIYVTRIGGGKNNVIESGNYSLNDREFSYS